MDKHVISLDHYEGGHSLNKGQKRDSKEILAESMRRLDAKSNLMAFTSDAGAGGGVTEAMVVTGLKADDEIVSVSQMTPGANSLPLLGWSTLAVDALTGIWSADPGAGAVIVVHVKRPIA